MKLVSATPAQVLSLITGQERRTLESQLSELVREDASEQCFIEAALHDLKVSTENNFGDALPWHVSVCILSVVVLINLLHHTMQCPIILCETCAERVQMVHVLHSFCAKGVDVACIHFAHMQDCAKHILRISIFVRGL